MGHPVDISEKSKQKPPPKARFQKGDLVRRNYERLPHTLDWRISDSEYDSHHGYWSHKIEPYFRRENNHERWPYEVPEKDKQWIVEERLNKEEETPEQPDEGAS